MRREAFSSGRHSVTGAFVFALVSLFAVLALLVVTTGIKAYRGVNAVADGNNRERGAISYLANRLRASDAADRIWLEDAGGTVCIREEIDGEEYCVRIYCDGESIRELFGGLEDEYDEGDGEMVAEAKSLLVTEEQKGLYRITVELPDGSGCSQRLALRSDI